MYLMAIIPEIVRDFLVHGVQRHKFRLRMGFCGFCLLSQGAQVIQERGLGERLTIKGTTPIIPLSSLHLPLFLSGAPILRDSRSELREEDLGLRL